MVKVLDKEAFVKHISIRAANPGDVYKVVSGDDPNLKFDSPDMIFVVLRDFDTNKNHILFNKYTCLEIERISKTVMVECIGRTKNTLIEMEK